MPMRSFEELTDNVTSVAALIPADVYANFILEGVVCYGQLSGVVTALEYDYTAGCGQIVQVPFVSPRTGSCVSSGACSYGGTSGPCLSAVSTTFGTYPITVNAWGDYDLLCGFALWEANCFPIMQLIMNEMSKRLARCRDARIWTALTGDGWALGTVLGTTITHFAKSQVSCGTYNTYGGSCCSFSYDLYNSIVSVILSMRADSYEPDYIIMNPNVAKFLYYKDGTGYWLTPLVTWNGGHLGEIAGVKVIESCAANNCNITGSSVQAVIIDSKRAVGEAWGKKPTFETQRIPDCNDTKLVVWQYWGADHMDAGAVGWILNP